MLDKAKKEIVDKAIEAIDNKKTFNPNYIEAIIENKMNEIRDKLGETKQNTSDFANFTIKYTNSYLQSKIMDVLSEGNALGLNELSKKTDMSKASLIRALERLKSRDLIVYENEGKERTFRKCT